MILRRNNRAKALFTTYLHIFALYQQKEVAPTGFQINISNEIKGLEADLDADDGQKTFYIKDLEGVINVMPEDRLDSTLSASEQEPTTGPANSYKM